jgi:hydrogenase maturation protein HypF
MWEALFDDLMRSVQTSVISARFHKGLAIAVVRMIGVLAADVPASANARTVALSGGVFQNRILFEQVAVRLGKAGFRVLSHRQFPSGDGGLSPGQAVVAAARARG